MAERKEKLISYLLDQNGLSETDVEPDGALFSSGLVDSFAMMDLVAFIEETFSIQVRAKEITLENFDSVTRITTYLDRKIG